MPDPARQVGRRSAERRQPLGLVPQVVQWGLREAIEMGVREESKKELIRPLTSESGRSSWMSASSSLLAFSSASLLTRRDSSSFCGPLHQRIIGITSQGQTHLFLFGFILNKLLLLLDDFQFLLVAGLVVDFKLRFAQLCR